MAVNKRLGAAFVSGLLLGAAAVARARKQPHPPPVPLAGPQKVAAPKALALPPQPATASPTLRSARTLPEFDFGPDEPIHSILPAEPAAPKSRYLMIFATLFLLTAALLVGAWTVGGPAFFSLDDRFSVTDAASRPMAQSGLPISACPLQPAVAAAGVKDGQLPLQADVSGLTAADIGSFLVIGKQSATAGQPRDAEAAFLMACRVADKLKGTGSVESADARFQLAAHYRALALAAGTIPAGDGQAELLQRAEGLYADSLPGYVAKYGTSSDQAKRAGEGLSAVRQALAQPPSSAPPVPEGLLVQASAADATGPAIPAMAAASAANPPPSPKLQPQTRKVETVRVTPETPPTFQAPGLSGGAGPSFDCRRARSNTEKMICADVELARLDRELGRAYARAKNATADPAAFQRQSELEWRRRETICQDRGCLLRWYAYRRSQLVSIIDGREQTTPPELR